MKRITDWILSIVGVVVIAILLVIHDPILKIGARVNRRHQERGISRLSRMCVNYFRLFGTKAKVEHNEGMIPGRGYIVISNHQSMVDIPLLLAYLPENTPAFVSKRVLGRWIPSVSHHLRFSGSALIDRHDARQSLRAIRETARSAQQRNGTVVIFPEGTRSRDGRLQEFQTAGSVILLRHAPALPVVPATVDGAWDMLSDKLVPARFGTSIRLKFGDPIQRRPDENHWLLGGSSA